MSVFLYELGRRCYRARRTVVIIWLGVLVVLAGLVGAVGGKYSDDFSIPGAPSQVALNQLQMSIPAAAALQATAIVIVPDGQSVNDPQLRAAIEAGADDFATLPMVESVIKPWNDMIGGLVAEDGRAALIELQLNSTSTEITAADRADLVEQASQMQAELPAGATVNMGGQAFSIEVPTLTMTEALGVVVALFVLLGTLGSLVAAGLPILMAVTGVAVSMCIIMIATGLGNINSTTPLLAVMLALAVGIDYALFILSRHRDQLAAGEEPEESAAKAIGTAGSAVVFAGLTVFTALLGLTLANIPFLAVMGVFAAVAVTISVLVALTLLPAMLGFLGARLTPRRRRTSGTVAAPTQGRRGVFARWVELSTRFPLLTIAVIVAALGALSVPAASLHMALPNSGQHSASQPDRIAYDLVNEHFGVGYNAPLIVTADLIRTNDPLGVMAGLREDIEAMPGVELVAISTPNQNADMGFVQLIPTSGPDDPATADLVHELRDRHDEWQDRYGLSTAVTGMTAVQIDVSERLTQALLPFGVFVVGLCLVLLMMVFRSVWVPIKATLGYLLSVGAAFGATQLVFNEGIGRQLVNLEKPTAIISFMPIIIMGILFGLAMDYEVFLVSRIREEYVHGRQRNPQAAPDDVARQAIHDGFVASGKVVAAAAVIMFSVFGFFVPEGMGPIKQIAFGLAVGVGVDAFVVRMTLVPAVLQLLGRHAWWLPGWLDRLLPSFDVEGEGLARQIRMRDWPSAEHTEVLHVEQFGSGQLFNQLDLHLEPGQVAALSGDTVPRSAAMLALSGRLQPTSGQARIAGELLPEHGARVRRHTGFVETTGNASIAGDLRAQQSRSHRVVFVDGADAIASTEDVAALQGLLDHARQGGEFAVVLGVSDPSAGVARQADLVIQVTAPQATVVATESAKSPTH